MQLVKKLFSGFFGQKNVSHGTVKWFSRQKRFGFIEQDDGGDIFVHLSQIQESGIRSLFQGDRVKFEVDRNEKGPFACNIKKL